MRQRSRHRHRGERRLVKGQVQGKDGTGKSPAARARCLRAPRCPERGEGDASARLMRLPPPGCRVRDAIQHGARLMRSLLVSENGMPSRRVVRRS